MRENTNKCKLPVHFSKAKLTCFPFVTIYYFNVFIFHQIYPNLLQFTYKVDQKMPKLSTFTQKLQQQKLTRALLVVHVTFRML